MPSTEEEQNKSERGRHRDLTEEQHGSVRSQFQEYLRRTRKPNTIDDLACLADFCTELYHQFDGIVNDRGKDLGEVVWRAYLEYHFSALVKRCSVNREAGIVRLAALGMLPPALAIFALKQLGWRDRQEIEHSGNLSYQISEDFTPAEEGDD